MASYGKRMVPEPLIKKLQDFKNNGLAALTASNITTLTTEQINSLKCGDIICKEDSTGKHAYIVSYKKDKTGICLTYADASVVETVSYDYSGSDWVYNSTDITPIKNVVANPTLAGTEANLTGLQVGDTKYAMPHLYRYEVGILNYLFNLDLPFKFNDMHLSDTDDLTEEQTKIFTDIINYLGDNSKFPILVNDFSEIIGFYVKFIKSSKTFSYSVFTNGSDETKEFSFNNTITTVYVDDSGDLNIKFKYQIF